MIVDVLNRLVEEEGSEVAAARRIGVGPSTLNRWRHALTYPGGISLQRIATATGATMADLEPPSWRRVLPPGQKEVVLSSVAADGVRRSLEIALGLEPGSLG